jgi:NADH:ubiquinone oxidoreductase subunit
MAKDSGPWPVYIGLALAAVICAGWAMLLHHRGKPPRAELTRPPPGR